MRKSDYKGRWDLLRVIALFGGTLELTMLIVGTVMMLQDGVFATIWTLIRSNF